MVINTNNMAINAHRAMKNTDSSITKASQKLSTGYKINSAADDAAGCAIVEKMRNQIHGLRKASRNADDGISLIQTAEGGISEIGDMLKRMSELSVQAANDTNVLSDREKIQVEIDQLKDEITETSNRIEFNNKKLLTGELGEGGALTVAQMNILEHLNGGWLTDALAAIQAQTGITFNNNVNMKVEFANMASGTIASMTSSSNKVDYTLKLNAELFKDATWLGTSGPVVGGILADRVITHEIMHGVMRNNLAPGVTVPMWFSEGLAEAVNGASDSRFGDFGNPAVQSMAQSLINSFHAGTSGYDSYTTGYLAVKYMDGLGTGISGVMSALSQGSTFENAVQSALGIPLANVITNMQTLAATNFSGFLTASGIQTGGGSYALNGVVSTAENIITNSGNATQVNESGDSISFGGITLNASWQLTRKGNPLYLKVGANENQSMNVIINEMSSAVLGISEIDVTSVGNALNSLTKSAEALDIINKERAKLGAYQNRLEHTVKNLDIAGVNLSDAESRIRDTDMAKEMMQLTKSKILQQASNSMLANANQSPQKVLSLLQ